MDEKDIEDTFDCQMAQCEVECKVPYGGVLFFSNTIVHCSYTNLSQNIRWSLDLRWQVNFEITYSLMKFYRIYMNLNVLGSQ